jgi:quercetin dioxygenase-like cupin family protein
MNDNVMKTVLEGKVCVSSGAAMVESLPWNNHPKFMGVALKHLLTAADTDGKFSSHIVRVQAGCEIGEHIHPGKWELHEVLQGQGTCLIDGKVVEYEPGTSAAIPSDLPHSVRAHGEDLYLMAKFVPALV